MCPVATTRWCPTPEQLMILEEMYRGGVRTPNATQILHITSHLSLYGKIEAKNVFYWFQNHKARDRQKLKRRLTKQYWMLQNHHHQQLQTNTKLPHHFMEIPSCSTTTTSGFHHHGHASHHNSSIFFADQVQRSEFNSTPCCTYHPQQHEKPTVSMMGRSYDDGDGDGYGDDNWVMITDVGPDSCCLTTRPPLKTLNLFPTTGTGLKLQGHHDHGNNDDETTHTSLEEHQLTYAQAQA